MSSLPRALLITALATAGYAALLAWARPAASPATPRRLASPAPTGPREVDADALSDAERDRLVRELGGLT